MKRFLLITFYIIKNYLTSVDVDEVNKNYSCKIQSLQYYGFEGITKPQDYPSLVQEMNNNYCPDIKHSCCTREDFSKTQRLWDQKARDIKFYVTKLFRVIQKISVLQSSLLSLSNDVRDKQTDKCREIDFTFFNSPVKYNEIYFYLENAFEAFAFLQKGFYCMLCDAKYHEFLAIEQERQFTRRVNVINHKMCNDLIFFFREFIMFKVYYLDPLFINTNLLFNCMEDTDKYKFNLIYNVTFGNIESCVEKGENCEFVCKEFKFGTTGDLFIGKLDQYKDFLNKVEELIKNNNPSSNFEDKKPGDELFIDDTVYPEEFFLDPEQGISSQNYNILKDYNMTQIEINVEEEGLNLFDIAYKSNYPLTNSLTTHILEKNYGTKFPGQDNDLNGGSQLDNFEYENGNLPDAFSEKELEKEKEDYEFEQKHEKEKLEEITDLPKEDELVRMEEMLEIERKKADKELRFNSEEPDLESKNNLDFGGVAEIEFLKVLTVFGTVLGLVI